MIELPFPPAALSGHNTGHWRSKSGTVRQWRMLAKAGVKAAGIEVPAVGDILVHVRFVPPDRRGDRVNYINRLKPVYDGIADGLGVNDRRFLPSFDFAEPQRPGRLEITVAAA